MLVLSAAGITVCLEKFERLLALAPQRIGAGIAFLCLCSILVFVSWLGFIKYPDFRGYHADYQMLAKQARFRNALVFVATKSEPEYGSAFWLNDFSAASDRPLFARDLGAEADRRVASAYPGRKIFFVDGRDVSKDHVRVTRGPLSLDDIK